MSDPLLDLDIDALVDDAIRRAEAQPPAERERHATAYRRNRAAAFLYLQQAGRRGVTSDDPRTEELLVRFRRDALRERGVDERLVRGAA